MQLRQAGGGDGEVPGAGPPGSLQPHLQLRDQGEAVGHDDEFLYGLR